jgi:hypothetical protein
MEMSYTCHFTVVFLFQHFSMNMLTLLIWLILLWSTICSWVTHQERGRTGVALSVVGSSFIWRTFPFPTGLKGLQGGPVWVCSPQRWHILRTTRNWVPFQNSLEKTISFHASPRNSNLSLYKVLSCKGHSPSQHWGLVIFSVQIKKKGDF